MLKQQSLEVNSGNNNDSPQKSNYIADDGTNGSSNLDNQQ